MKSLIGRVNTKMVFVVFKCAIVKFPNWSVFAEGRGDKSLTLCEQLCSK